MRPIIACNLDDYQIERLREHCSDPVLIDYARDRPAWEVPPDAEILFTFFKGWQPSPAAPPPGWPFGLKWIQVGGAGVDIFPAWFFAGPPVTTGRGVTADTIGEYAIAAIFAHEKQLFDGLRVHSGAEWTKRTLGQVSGRKLGILGLGAIGAQAGVKAHALGMKVGYVSRSASQSVFGDFRAYPSLEAMIADVDHLLLAVPLTAATRRLIGPAALAVAKSGLHIINVCRGEVIDDNALLEALDRRQVAAATLDVTFPEPLPEGHPFYQHPRIRLTPHSPIPQRTPPNGWPKD